MTGKSTKTAKAGKQKPKKNPGGAKCKYTDKFPALAEKLAGQGLNDEQIASGLNISLDTYYSYQKRFPKFSEAIRRGKGPVDNKAENALYKRALGYYYDEKTTETTEGPNGVWTKERVTRKHVPADIGALHTWLFNRMPDVWQSINAPRKNNEAIEIPTLNVEEVPFDEDILPFVKPEEGE